MFGAGSFDQQIFNFLEAVIILKINFLIFMQDNKKSKL